MVLTLADQRVVTGARNAYGSAGVNDDEDELENVNIAEFQKTATAKARAAQKKYYDATDDSEFTGEGGMARIRQRSLILLCWRSLILLCEGGSARLYCYVRAGWRVSGSARFIYIYMYIYVCIYVYMYVCMYVRAGWRVSGSAH